MVEPQRSTHPALWLQVFTSRYRAKFLQLTDVFLASSLVPAYTVAAFVKRFARIAVTAPPMGAVVCTAFVHNLLRRHPSCTCMLHQPGADGAEGAGLDPYDDAAEDPAESRAVESSLWELGVLRHHVHPMVRAEIATVECAKTMRCGECVIGCLYSGATSEAALCHGAIT